MRVHPSPRGAQSPQLSVLHPMPSTPDQSSSYEQHDSATATPFDVVDPHDRIVEGALPGQTAEGSRNHAAREDIEEFLYDGA